MRASNDAFKPLPETVERAKQFENRMNGIITQNRDKVRGAQDNLQWTPPGPHNFRNFAPQTLAPNVNVGDINVNVVSNKADPRQVADELIPELRREMEDVFYHKFHQQLDVTMSHLVEVK